MTEQQFLFDLPPKKYVPFQDVYHLKGEEKVLELNKMIAFIENFKNTENPTQTDKRHYFDACIHLERDIIRQTTRLHLSLAMYAKLRNTLVATELETFKTKVKLAFMEKHQKEIESGEFTAQMSKDLDKLTRMEKVACYKIEGIDITIKDCEICKNKICQRKPKWELEAEEVEEKETKEIANE
uniref:Uncharacterized protein n=1 Tax=viral metagenome TaxID=1070528 RepID=A0A6M3LYW6_9ZZZZ